MLWLAAGLALAADPQYLLEYRAYRDALERGDPVAAQAHAHAAWQAAEGERGDDKLTAILAFNFAQQALFADSEQAVVAIRRANDMRGLAAERLPTTELDLYLAYLELATGENDRRNARVLRELLDAIGDESTEFDFEVATISLALAVLDFSAGRLGEAAASATMAEAAITRVNPDDILSLSTAGITKGAALLLRAPWRETAINAARAEFRKVSMRYPPQPDIESFAPGLAQSLAWDFAAHSLLQSIGASDAEGPWRSRRSLFVGADGAKRDCGSIEWARQTKPEYPREALRKGYIGAVLVGFHVGEDLGIEGARILAEVPSAQFGEAVLNAMDGWQIDSLQPNTLECRRNRVTLIRFIMSR